MIDFNKKVLEESFKKPVVVLFGASWCEPCTWVEPILKELHLENKTEWKLVKVDIDRNEEDASRLSIKSVPATHLFYKGKTINSYNGMMYKKEFGEWIKKTIKQAA